MKRYGYIGLIESDYSYRQSISKEQRKEQENKLKAITDTLVIDTAFRKKEQMNIDKQIAKLEKGDVVVVCNLKYLAANISRLLERLNAIETMGASIEVLDIKGNSLTAHANAISEFNKFVRGSKISKGMLSQTRIKHLRGVVNNSRASIQDWRIQHSIALARKTGKKTVKELSTEHGVTPQVIYRICNKEHFKDVEPLKYNFEYWGLEECKRETTVEIVRSEKRADIGYFLGKQNILIFAAYSEDRRITREKALDEFLSMPTESLEKIYDAAKSSELKLHKEIEDRKNKP